MTGLAVLRAALCSILLLAAAPVSAQEEAGDRVLERARAALRRAQPERAIAILEEASAQLDDPRLLHELYVAHLQAGHRPEAIRHLSLYLESDAEIDDEARASLEGHLADLRALEAPPPERDWFATTEAEALGWVLLAAGVAGAIVFVIGASVATSFENATDPGTRDAAWAVAWSGLGAGLGLGAAGAVILVLHGVNAQGAARALPPSLDPNGAVDPLLSRLGPSWAPGLALEAEIRF